MMAESSDCVNGKVSDNENTTATQYLCTPCQLEKKELTAEGFCKTCDEYLCETCFRYHIRLLVSRNHVMLSKDKMPRKEIVHEENDVLEEICEHHESKIVEFYCKTCDIVGYLICVTSGHENCEVVYIPEYTKELELNEIGHEQTDNLNYWSIFDEAEENIPSQYKWTIELHAENIRDNVKMYRKEINETIEKIELNLDRKIKEMKRVDFEMLDSFSQKIGQQKCKLQKLFRDIRPNCMYVSSAKTKNKLFVSTKLFPNALKQFEQCKASLQTELKSRSNNLEADEELKFSLRQVLDRPKKVRKNVKLKDIARVDVKQNLETFEEGKTISKCSISACIAISEDTLLLNDSENCYILLCRIKESSEQEDSGLEERTKDMDIICRKSVTASPWDITEMDEKEVAVTLPSRKQIQFLKVKDTDIELTGCTNVKGKCNGIAYMDNKLYVSFDILGKVEIIDRKRRFHRTVSSNFPEGVPQFQFSRPKYIACDKERRLTFIADYGNDCIAVINTDGEIKSVIHYTSLHLDKKLYSKWMRRPLAMAVRNDGTLFVAVDSPFSIQMISPDFQQKDVLIYKGATWGIRALTLYNNKLYFCTDTGALYVREIINI